jgi:hypothetical protein
MAAPSGGRGDYADGEIEFIFKRSKHVASRDPSTVHAGIVESANGILVGNNNHRLAIDADRIGIIVVDCVAMP